MERVGETEVGVEEASWDGLKVIDAAASRDDDMSGLQRDRREPCALDEGDPIVAVDVG